MIPWDHFFQGGLKFRITTLIFVLLLLTKYKIACRCLFWTCSAKMMSAKLNDFTIIKWTTQVKVHVYATYLDGIRNSRLVFWTQNFETANLCHSFHFHTRPIGQTLRGYLHYQYFITCNLCLLGVRNLDHKLYAIFPQYIFVIYY